jgi:hypothetical protein
MTIKGAMLAAKRALQSRRGARIRAQVVAPFRTVRNGIDDKAVYAITKDWYRSSGGEWTLCLS